jgi:multiple sugar transport system substrate-binding protein
MKKTLALFVTLCIRLAVFGCAGKRRHPPPKRDGKTAGRLWTRAAEAPAEDVTITFCNFNAAAEGRDAADDVRRFPREFPNITVEIETIGYSDYFTQMDQTTALRRYLAGLLRTQH